MLTYEDKLKELKERTQTSATQYELKVIKMAIDLAYYNKEHGIKPENHQNTSAMLTDFKNMVEGL